MDQKNKLDTPNDIIEFNFKEFIFFNGFFKINLPDFFVDMHFDDKNTGTIPGIIKTNETKDIFFTFDKVSEILNINTVQKVLDQQRRVVSRLAPGYKEFGYGTKQINNNIIACLEYKSNAVYKDLYNVFYMISLENEMVVGTFTCPYVILSMWRPIFLACIDSIHTYKNAHR